MWHRKAFTSVWTAALILPVFALLALGFQPMSPLTDGDPSGIDRQAQQASEYQAEITGLDGSAVTGQARFMVSGDTLTVSLEAEGLAEGQHPQHIHTGSSCDDVQGVLVPLEPFPSAGADGTVSYENANLEVPENLGDRTVVIHGTDGAPVACGPINPADGS